MAKRAEVILIHKDKTQSKFTVMAYRGGEKAGGAATLAVD